MDGESIVGETGSFAEGEIRNTSAFLRVLCGDPNPSLCQADDVIAEAFVAGLGDEVIVLDPHAADACLIGSRL